MIRRLDRAHRSLPTIIGGLTLALAVLLIVGDFYPRVFSVLTHDSFSAIPLLLIALAYLIYQSVRRPGFADFSKAVLLAIAFVFWAVCQWSQDVRISTLTDDFAILLFVLDVFLVIIGWPKNQSDESFAEVHPETDKD